MNFFHSILLIFNVILTVHCYEPLLVDQLRWDFLVLEDKLWKFVLDPSTKGQNNTNDPGLVLIKHFNDFDQRIQQVPDDILYGLQVIQSTRPFLFIFSDVRVIHDIYDKFRRIQLSNLKKEESVESGYFQELRISHLIDDILYDSKNNINKTILNMLKMTFPTGIYLTSSKDVLMKDVLEILADSNYYCKYNDQPPQQLIYHIYNIIAITELKGYIMMQFAYMAQRLEERGNYTQAALSARKQYEERADFYTIRTLMSIAPSSLYRCDPNKQVEGETFVQLTGLLQGHVENEVDMNSGRTCKKNCQSYSLTSNHGCYDYESEYCRKRKPCGGRILNCRFIESHMTACISPSWSSRRYSYIQYDSGKVLGKKTWCPGKSINSWYRWFVHCSYCFCLCDQQGLFSDRYFNLRPVMADVANNRVVTGLRIVKHNRIIHLQIQEGKLLPYGYIDKSTIKWVPVDNYKITDWGVKNGEDFHTIDFQKRTLLLDDLKPNEEDHIITGVRFEYIGNHLRFQINVRGFNFTTGVLLNNSYYIYGSDDNRQKINIDDSDIPTDGPRSELFMDSNKYIEFTHSSISKDAAQTTVPFFDAQPVAASPAVPLIKAGISYKGIKGYGGFVTPRITTYNFHKHLQMRFPKAEARGDPDTSYEPLTN